MTRNVASKYDVIFANLPRGGEDCHVELDVVQTEKVAARLNSAITAYRKRSGDRSAFSVRSIAVDGKSAVAVWKLDSDITGRVRSAKA
jgi:hypothetical protein